MKFQLKRLAVVLGMAAFWYACSPATQEEGNASEETQTEADASDEFKYLSEQFADLKLIRYQVPGFEELSTKEKELLYYLYQAALSGRDMMYDQNYVHNLTIRRTLEAIIQHGQMAEGTDKDKLLEYTKRVWFSNGIHHHYANDKFKPEFSEEFFKSALTSVPAEELPLSGEESAADLAERLSPIIFDPTIAPKKVSLDSEKDIVANSAVNFYSEDVTKADVEAYMGSIDRVEGNQPEYGLNTKLVKENGNIVAKTWKVGGMYAGAIEKIVYWLEKATAVAENEQQRITLEKLINYYNSGDVADWDAYNIEWVNDTNSRIDVVNGFIEVYNDPMGSKGSFESVVSFKDLEASKRIAAVGAEAQWFEDNSPLMEEHKKKEVKGISAKVITVVVESGDASPSTPIGINLPNSNWVRKEHGSKSVNLGNIVHAYEMSSKEGKSSLDEFTFSKEEADRAREHGSLADLLHTDLHEVIGHASGQINPGVGTPNETLENYASTLEEGRADLVALYYLMDEKLIDIGVMNTLEVGKASYDDYIRNGLMLQLKRLELGAEIEEAHMRNRQLVAGWAYEQGKAEKVIEKVQKEGKTYFVINDYQKLRVLFGDLLRELQRIKSEGDYEAGKHLVETYGVKVDPDLHAEVLERYEKLGIAPYGGFINPKLVPIMEGDQIVDVKIEYPEDFQTQMLEYAKDYSFLPNKN